MDKSTFGALVSVCCSRAVCVCVCVRGDEGTCQHVFLIVFGQRWSSVAQRKTIYQALVQGSGPIIGSVDAQSYVNHY